MHLIKNNTGVLWIIKIKIATVMLLTVSYTINAQIEEVSLKALFLEAAIRFITWPEARNSVNLNEKRFVVGIFNDQDKMSVYLKKAFSIKKVKDKDVKFIEIDSIAKIADCDLIFISNGQKGQIGRICEIAAKYPVLTVTDAPDMTRKGVILSLGIEKSRIVCYVNEEKAIKSGFKISHHLLQKSTVVTTLEQKS